MIEWTRAERDGSCGGCGRRIVIGQAIRVTNVVGVTHKFIRCEECVGAAPPDLPPLTAPPLIGSAPLRAEPKPSRIEWTPYRDSE
jgi:hypothetical protein